MPNTRINRNDCFSHCCASSQRFDRKQTRDWELVLPEHLPNLQPHEEAHDFLFLQSTQHPDERYAAQRSDVLLPVGNLTVLLQEKNAVQVCVWP